MWYIGFYGQRQSKRGKWVRHIFLCRKIFVRKYGKFGREAIGINYESRKWVQANVCFLKDWSANFENCWIKRLHRLNQQSRRCTQHGESKQSHIFSLFVGSQTNLFDKFCFWLRNLYKKTQSFFSCANIRHHCWWFFSFPFIKLDFIVSYKKQLQRLPMNRL